MDKKRTEKDMLTILVPLKGRVSYTKRFLEYCNLVGNTFPVVLLDGGTENNLEEITKEYDFASYHRRPFDKDIKTFVQKMSYGMKQVKTPFAVIVDNDDFFDPAGFVESVRWLNDNSAWVSYCGDVKAFVLSDKNVISPDRSVYTKPSVVGDTFEKRIQNCFKQFHSFWHNVTRTEVLKTVFDLISASEINDFKFVSMLQSCLIAVFGQIKRNKNISYYYHQVNSPEISGVDRISNSDWVLRDNWIREFVKAKACFELLGEKPSTVFQESFLNFLVSNDDAYHRFSEERKIVLEKGVASAAADFIKFDNINDVFENYSNPKKEECSFRYESPGSSDDFSIELQFYLDRIR